MTNALRTPAASRRLSAAVDEFENAHRLLANAPDSSEKLRAVIFQGGRGPALDPIARKFIVDARMIAALDGNLTVANGALRRMRSIGAEVLPRALQETLEIHQSAVKTHSEQIGLIQNGAFIAALVMLVLEAVLIFFPAHLAARQALDRLAENAERLRQAQDNIEARNKELDSLRRVAEHDALHDGLTGLANRRGFEREMTRFGEIARETGGGVAVLHIDLDCFKQINDTLGHAAGDFILSHVADVLRKTTLETDFVARVGGDEFVIVRRCGDDRRPLEALAARTIEQLSKPIYFQGELCSFGASVGIDIGIACDSGAEFDPRRLMANADIALYRAKELGRGRFEFFCDNLRRKVEASKMLTDEISLALGRDEFFPVYQPQFDAHTGEICGVEALVRWRHPEKGVLPPSDFLPIAERLDILRKIDHLVLSKALEDFASWEAQGATVPRLSVNVASSRLLDHELIPSLAELTIPHGRLSFEVLETTFVDQGGDSLRYTLDALAEAGIDLEIDNFGSGNTSLTGLLAITPSRLKIARALIAPTAESQRHAGLIRSIADFAVSLGIGVTAEGVETEAQREVLVAAGCDRLQGYLLARPMSSEALAELILSRKTAAAVAV